MTDKDKKPVPLTNEIGQPGFALSSSFVKDIKKEELSPQCIWNTFDQMEEDPSIYTPLYLTQTLCSNALGRGAYQSTGTRKSKVITEYLNHCIHNMQGMTWMDAVNSFNTNIKNGFSLGEVVVGKPGKGPYANTFTLKNIGPRAPSNVYAWLWDKEERHVTHMVQKPFKTTEYLKNKRNEAYYGNITDTASFRSNKGYDDYPIIPMGKLLHMTYNGSMGNPQGKSPLIACFDPWQEKEIISQYEVIGITRDFGGIPVARVPSELMNRANSPEEGFEAEKAEFQSYQDQLANMHAGKQNFFILSSDIAEGSTSIYEYDIELLGVNGGGKQYDTDNIVKAKTAEIYNVFGCGYLLLGQGGNTSSYNLSTTGRSIHSHMLEKDLISKALVLKHQLAVMLLDKNRIEYSYKDLPDFVYEDPDRLSFDEAGKFIQRAMSTGGLTREAAEYIYKASGLPLEGLDKLDFTSGGDSRAGESKGTSGTGVSQQGSANSSTNVENKQLGQSGPVDLIKIDEYNGQDVYQHKGTGKVAFIDKET